MEEGVTTERVIDVASRLFAGLGYDLTSLDLIADAVGVPPAEILTLTGGKRDLYLRVMQRVFEEKKARIEAAAAGDGSGRTALHRIADAYLDYYAEHPQFLALWTHRSASDASDITDVEDRYMRPLMRLAAHRIRDEVPEDISAHALLGVVLWCINGFLGTGILAPGHGMTRADDPATLGYFRAVMHTVIDRLLTRPRPGPEG
jgi:AcrR family transcriptional regulator